MRNVVVSAVTGLTMGLVGSVVAAGGPIGELEVRGQVRVGQQAADGVVTVRDTTYGWFSGDRIETLSGQAVLNLDGGGSIGFGKATEAGVSAEEGRVSTHLEAGVILYAFEGDSVEFSVTSGEYTFSTRSGEARAVPVASDPPTSVGMIEVLEDGQVRVDVFEGMMLAADASGALHYQVESGQAVAFAGTEPRHVEVQFEAAQAEDDDDRGLFVWMRNNPLLTGLIVVAGTFGAYKLFFDSSSSDPDQVSP